jgi:hypothetical protein
LEAATLAGAMQDGRTPVQSADCALDADALAAWTTAQKETVRAFVKNLPPREPPGAAAGVDVKLPVGRPPNPAATLAAAGALDVMLIGVMRSGIERPRLIKVGDFDALLVELDKKSRVASLFDNEGASARDHVVESLCAIAADGRMAEVVYSGAGVLREPARGMVTPAFRADVAAALRGDHTAAGPRVCGLERAGGWPPDLRARVMTFVESAGCCTAGAPAGGGQR